MFKAFKKFEKLVDQSKIVLIIISRPLDFDCIGSGLVLKKYLESKGKKVTIMWPGHFSNEDREYYSFLPHFDEIIDFDTREILSKKNFDLLILVDGTNLIQFYESIHTSLNPPDLSIYNQIVNIDHHLGGINEELSGLTIRDHQVSSTAEVILNKIIPAAFIDPKIATLAYGAIAGDTGNFRWGLSPRTLKTAGMLLAKGAEVLKIVDRLFHYKTKTYFQMLAYAIENCEYREDLETMFLFLPDQKLKSVKLGVLEVAELKAAFQEDLAKRVRGFTRGIIVYEKIPGKTGISARGNSLYNQINLPRMLTELGGNGGGHFNACGMDVDGNFDEIKEKLIKLIEKYVKEQKSSLLLPSQVPVN